MNKTDTLEYMKKDITRLFRQTGKLNGYVNNIKRLNMKRIDMELKQIRIRANEISKNIHDNLTPP